MSSRHIVVCDVCEREVRVGAPTDKSVPQTQVINMHSYGGFNVSLDICRECAEKTPVFILWEKTIDTIKKGPQP